MSEDWKIYYNKDQNFEDPVVDDVRDLLLSRSRLGLLKYGRNVSENPLTLRSWMMHALEECLDQAIYLRRAIAEIDAETDDGR